MNLSSAVECPVRLAGELAESVQYRGRKASRQGSEQRRLSILEAALRIIVREGLRGVRHRAVAAEADVPLSATTYYFNDIQDLIADSFALCVKRSCASLAALWAGLGEDGATHSPVFPPPSSRIRAPGASWSPISSTWPWPTCRPRCARVTTSC